MLFTQLLPFQSPEKHRQPSESLISTVQEERVRRHNVTLADKVNTLSQVSVSPWHGL